MAKIAVILLLLLLLSVLQATITPGVDGLPSDIKINWDGTASTVSAAIQTFLGRNVPSQFHLHLPSDYSEKRGLILEIVLEQFWQEYDVVREYNFTLPNLDVSCICDCPGGDDSCNKNYEGYNGCRSNDRYPNKKDVMCFKKYSAGHAATNCFFNDDAEMCCHAAIYSDDSPEIYHAVYLSSPQVKYKLSTKLLTGDGKVFENLPCGDKSNPVCEVAFDYTLPLVSSFPHSLWAYIDPVTKALMVNAKINDVDEKNLDKLGWFKFIKNKSVTDITAHDARNALDVYVSNCVDNSFSWKFNAVGLKENTKLVGSLEKEFGQPLQMLYKAIVEKVYIEPSKHIVRIYPKASSISSLLLKLNIKIPIKVIAQYSRATFGKFTPVIVLDEFYNNVLMLDIEDAFGQLFVSVSDGKECKMFEESFIVDAKLRRSQIKIKIPHCACLNRLVCLYTADRIFSHCVRTACKELKFPGLISANDKSYSKNNITVARSNVVYQSASSTTELVLWPIFGIAIVAIVTFFVMYWCYKNKMFSFNNCRRNKLHSDVKAKKKAEVRLRTEEQECSELITTSNTRK